MKFIDRRILFPAVAMTALAQQTAPVPPAIEKALRARVEQFMQLEVDKKFRLAEAMVAEDSKDDFYNGSKPDIKKFTWQKAEFSDHNTKAKVTVKADVVAVIAGAPAPLTFSVLPVTYWKLEKKQWVWYVEHQEQVQTPFGTFSPGRGGGGAPAMPQLPSPTDLASIDAGILIDKTKVVLSAAGPEDVVTITNKLPAGIKLELAPEATTIPGLNVSILNADLPAGQKAQVSFKRAGTEKVADTVRVIAKPLNKVFDIQVNAN